MIAKVTETKGYIRLDNFKIWHSFAINPFTGIY